MLSPRQKFLEKDEDEDQDNLVQVIRSEYKPSPIGIRFHLSTARKRLNVGGLGSGKSRMMCEHLNNLCMRYPGAKVIIARRDLGDLKKTTQSEYLERVVSPDAIDRFNINDNTLYYKNGSMCFFMETKTPSNFKSLEIIAWGVDEADENEEGQGKDRLLTVLDGRLRQKIKINGELVAVPYVGIFTYNPTTDDHWLAKLEDKPDPDMEVFRSSTYDNLQNLPNDYIPSLLSSLAPWEVKSLVYGERASQPKGKPVLHGFSLENNVRPLRLFHHLPLRVSWDFGFNHPCVSISQYDPEFKRFMKLREFSGSQEQLQFFAPKAIKLFQTLGGPLFPVRHYGDPHGADKKDVGESSIEYLRIHQGVHVNHKRTKIKTGLDEMQELIVTKAPFRSPEWTPEQPQESLSRFLVDPSCKATISAYMGGYYRGEDGSPVKDDFHDHFVDTDRYTIVHTMGAGLAAHKKSKRYIPRNKITGY